MTNEKVDRMRLRFHVLGTTVLALLLNSLLAFSQLSVPLITQEALPPNTPGLARRTEPVTVGVPLSDSQGVSSVSQLGLSGVSVGQFRCLARWPSANCKWVEIDYELPALAAGGSKTVTLTYGKGNFGGRDLAADSRPNDASAGTITVNTGVGGCVFTIQKARFDVLHMVVCDGKTLVDGGSTGLTLMGPAYAAKPASTTCAFDSTCAALYASSNDPSSACVVEENGPARAAVRCSGGLKDIAGNRYMGFLVRLHFYAGKQQVKMVATLKNADDGAAGSFPVSYKGYQSFELRLSTKLTGSNIWTIGTDGAHTAGCPSHGYCSGRLAAGQDVYIYQGYSAQNLDPGFNSALQFRSVALANAAVDITRGNQGRDFVYAQDGYIVVGPGAPVIGRGTSSSAPRSSMGWADVREASGGQGITFGTDYMQGNFPRSLEIRNGGREIRIGISPNQGLWKGVCGTPALCRKVYYQPWPEYKIANLDLIFYASDSASRAQDRFLRMQYPLIARAPITYYNSTKVLAYPLVDPVQHDRYMNGIAARSGRQFIPLKDAAPVITRFYDWSAGGSANQAEYRYGDLVHRWLERGFAGRYVNTIWFTRFQEQFAWERSDNITCVAHGARYTGWACHESPNDLSPYNASPSRCTFKLANTCTDNSGMMPNNCSAGVGCRGGYVDPVADENSSSRHYHWWSAIYNYLMTGDEDIHDLLIDGVTNEYTAIGSAGNYTKVSGNGNLAATPQFNLSWQASGMNNRLGQSGSFGGRLGSAAHLWRFLVDTGDTQNANFVHIMIRNLLSVMYREPCATTGTGSLNQNWPSGCTPKYDGYANGQQTRGFSAYRGQFFGPNEANNVVRCVPAQRQNVIADGRVRCIEPFMQGYLIDAVWALTQLEGPAWGDYQKLLDLAYGDAINTDASNYLVGLANHPEPSQDQLVYTMAADQPNDLSWKNPYSAGDVNGPGPPSEAIYSLWGNYTGELTPWRSHWENTYLNYAANHSYAADAMPEYGTQMTDSIVALILHPAISKLITVCSGTWKQPGCSASYDSQAGKWMLRWTAPADVSKYYLKENNAKMIVDNIGWSNSTNTPLDPDVATDYNWFALGNNVETTPLPRASAAMVSAPSTAHFMLKALVSASRHSIR